MLQFKEGGVNLLLEFPMTVCFPKGVEFCCFCYRLSPLYYWRDVVYIELSSMAWGEMLECEISGLIRLFEIFVYKIITSSPFMFRRFYFWVYRNYVHTLWPDVPFWLLPFLYTLHFQAMFLTLMTYPFASSSFSFHSVLWSSESHKLEILDSRNAFYIPFWTWWSNVVQASSYFSKKPCLSASDNISYPTTLGFIMSFLCERKVV